MDQLPFDVCSLDATRALKKYGTARYMNHSKQRRNLKGHLVENEQGEWHLCFTACRDIKKGEELLIDYGDRRRSAVDEFEWLKK
jgi:histone-lysine N-methyltransferase SETD8